PETIRIDGRRKNPMSVMREPRGDLAVSAEDDVGDPRGDIEIALVPTKGPRAGPKAGRREVERVIDVEDEQSAGTFEPSGEERGIGLAMNQDDPLGIGAPVITNQVGQTAAARSQTAPAGASRKPQPGSEPCLFE